MEHRSCRFFRDRKNEPFVIILDSLHMLPVLVAKSHAILKNSERTKAFSEIKVIANRVFGGSLYLLKTYHNGGHFAVMAKKVEEKNGRDGFRALGVEELKRRMAVMAGGERSLVSVG